MLFQRVCLRKCLLSCAKILVFAKVCACAKLLIYWCMPKNRDEKKSRNDSLRSADMPVFHTPRHHVVEVANDIDFSIYVNNPDSDNIAYRDKQRACNFNL